MHTTAEVAQDPLGMMEPAPKPRRSHERARYELETPEKKAYGLRMRRAREACGMSLTEAATALGYSQPVQLSLMENGKRIPTLAAVVSLARLYGTTADFLCGFTAGLDRDPAVSAEVLIASRVSAEVRRLIATMIAVSHGAVRELRPDAGKVHRLAGVALELSAVVERMRRSHPTFDDEMPCGAMLVSKAEVAATLAREVIGESERARRALRQAPVDLGFAVDGLDGAGDDAPAAAFWPPRPVAPGALDPDEPLELEDDPSSDRALCPLPEERPRATAETDRSLR